MAPSTLTLTRDDLRKAVGNLLGLGVDITAWDSEFATRVDMVVDIGCRSVYEPELLPGDAEVHVWSFLQPKLFSFRLQLPYKEGTVEVVNGVVTLTDGTWPAWAADGEFVITGEVAYQVASRDSDTQITLFETTLNAEAGTAYTLQQVDYTLPELWAGFVGDLFLNQTNSLLGHRLDRGDKQELLALQKAGVADFSSRPSRYATFTKEQTGEGDQRWMLTVWPLPDASYSLTGYYKINAYQLTESLSFPMGGLPLSECMREAVLAAAEVEFQGEMGVHNQLFRAKLTAAISMDRQMHNPNHLGRNKDLSHEREAWLKHGPRVRHVGLGDQTYTGHPYDWQFP